MKRMYLLYLSCALFLLVGCTQEVPPGYIGMVMTPNGLSKNTLAPGRHVCWNRDKLYLIQTKESSVPEKMSILCKDDLNFKFDLNVRAKLRQIKNADQFKDILYKKGSDMQDVGNIVRILLFKTLYSTYVKPLARSAARGAVSKYQTTQVRENRVGIEKEILKKLMVGLKKTPMEVVVVTTSNFDYPEVITAAVEKKRQREIEIDEERANQAKELLKAENRLKLAEKMKQVKAAEAQADAIGIQILGKSLTPSYLKWKAIERDKFLYGRVGAGDKVIITGQGSAIPIIK